MTTTIAPEQTQSLSTTTTNPYDPLSFSTPEDWEYFSSSQTTTLAPDNLIFLDPAHDDMTDDPLYHDSDASPLTSSAFDMDGHNSVESSDFAKEVQQQSSKSCINEQSHNILEYNPRLSSLNLDLSRRLEQCLPNGASEDGSKLNETQPGTRRIIDGGTKAPDGLSESSLFEHALGDLSEFLVIIQQYTSKKTVQFPGAPDNSGQGFISNSNRRISIVVILNLISAYLQIVVIYNQIFQDLSAQLSETSNGPNRGQRTLPGLKLTGLLVGQGNLQTKILIHAILHQFDLIERLLGLPAELRVTDKPGVYSGLFGDDRGRALLGAVTHGNRNENEWCQTQVDDNRLSKALSSLRETIKNIQVSLEL